MTLFIFRLTINKNFLKSYEKKARLRNFISFAGLKIGMLNKGGKLIFYVRSF